MAGARRPACDCAKAATAPYPTDAEADEDEGVDAEPDADTEPGAATDEGEGAAPGRHVVTGSISPAPAPAPHRYSATGSISPQAPARTVHVLVRTGPPTCISAR